MLAMLFIVTKMLIFLRQDHACPPNKRAIKQSEQQAPALRVN